MITFVVTVAVTSAALGILYGLRDGRSRWLDGPDKQDRRGQR